MLLTASGPNAKPRATGALANLNRKKFEARAIYSSYVSRSCSWGGRDCDPWRMAPPWSISTLFALVVLIQLMQGFRLGRPIYQSKSPTFMAGVDDLQSWFSDVVADSERDGDEDEYYYDSSYEQYDKFSKLPDVPLWLSDNCNNLNFSMPTIVQQMAIPLIMTGKDVILQAQTGSGKTLAYSVPILSKIDPTRSAIQAVIVVPTRELCMQVAGMLTLVLTLAMLPSSQSPS
jgi:hypothetical protein